MPIPARRTLVLVIAVAVVVVVAGCSSSSKSGSTRSTPSTTAASEPGSSVGTTAPTTGPSPNPATGALRIATAPWQLPEGRAREVVVAGTHSLLVIAGLDPGKSSTARVWNVALPAGTTTRLATLPTAVHDASGASIAGSTFVFGGGNASEVASVQRYHAGAATVAGRLPQPRSDTVATEIDGKAFVLGGYDGSSEPASVLETDDGTTFIPVARLAQTVRYAALAVLAGRIFLFGGEHHGTTVSTVQIVDPHPGDASITGQLPMPLTEATAVVLDDQILVIGGRSGGRILDAVQRFDPATGAFTIVGHLPYPVADAGATVVDGVAYVVGGETPAVTASVITLRHG